MSGFSVQVNDGVTRALRRLSARLADMTPVMTEIGQTLVTEADLAFREQRDPWGNAWAALRPVTLARRRGDRAHILRDTGRLANSINYQADARGVTVGTNVIYAATHQFGREDNRFYNTPKGRPAPIPARPFLPIDATGVRLSADTAADIADIVRSHMNEALRA